MPQKFPILDATFLKRRTKALKVAVTCSRFSPASPSAHDSSSPRVCFGIKCMNSPRYSAYRKDLSHSREQRSPEHEIRCFNRALIGRENAVDYSQLGFVSLIGPCSAQAGDDSGWVQSQLGMQKLPPAFVLELDLERNQLVESSARRPWDKLFRQGLRPLDLWKVVKGLERGAEDERVKALLATGVHPNHLVEIEIGAPGRCTGW